MRFFGRELSTSNHICGLGSRWFLVFLTIGAIAQSSIAQAQWQTNFADAYRLAAKTKKPIFVDFYAEWCGPCKMLEKDTFSDSRVKTLFGNTVCLRIDIDKHEADARKFGVSSIPRLILLTPDGKGVLWDTMGYREANDFAAELSEALHVKIPISHVEAPPAEPPALIKVRAALGSPGGLAKLESSDPASAKSGLKLLVEQLGVFAEPDFQTPAKQLESLGPRALPALYEGMQSKTLATRVGAYKVVQAILGKASARYPSFDPWAPKARRANQLMAWRKLIAQN